ncbi:MAG: alpha/beta fold hydrolase [Deltaproteobacteria bacterium]|nr:alpha/beta fold hydrolase [Deltaproteobacteria bacterium]
MAVSGVGYVEECLRVGETRIQLFRGGRGDPVVVLHGAGGGSWLPTSARLAEAFTVYAPVHPGFGASDDPPWLQGVDDLVLFYLDFLDTLGLERVHLIGTSLGGWIAAEFAVSHQHRLRSLVLVDAAGIHVPGAEMADLFVMDPTTRARTLFHNPAVLEQALAAQPTPEMLQVELRQRVTVAKLAWNPYFHNPKLPRRLGRIRVPTLILWGRHDHLIPSAVGQAYEQAIPGARLVFIEEAGHSPLREAPEACAKAIIPFLRGHV